MSTDRNFYVLDRLVTWTRSEDTGVKDDYNHPITRDVTSDLWAKRMDGSPRDDFQTSPTGLRSIMQTEYVFRYFTAKAMQTGDRITEDGRVYTVEGLAEVGRRRWIRAQVQKVE